MKTVAFVFARGGSKGLPGKNIRPLAGKPLLCYSIELAKADASIDAVFVSTDCAQIRQVALDAGALVIDRPPELASDTAPEWLAWRHAISYVRQQYGDFSEFVSLPATSPLRAPCDLSAALQQYRATGADVCLAVTPANRNPYFNMVRQSENGLVELFASLPQGVSRRQDAPAVYDLTTVVYVAKPDFVMEQAGIFSGRVCSIEVPKQRAVDIDDEFDFLLAQTILQSRSAC
jgi:N-acylneuraminate cytidylyltransferase